MSQNRMVSRVVLSYLILETEFLSPVSGPNNVLSRRTGNRVCHAVLQGRLASDLTNSAD